SSRGSPENGAEIVSTRSRYSASARGLPPSSASAQYSVAGCAGRQETLRGPVCTQPPGGRLSSSGCDATWYTTAPLRSQTSISCGKRYIGTWYEYGFTMRRTSTNSPLGEGSTPAKIAGRPIGVRAPVVTSTTASCAGK